MQLRPYQKEAIAAIQKHFNDGELRTLLVMATGCGKTVVFTSIAQSVVKKGGRVLILAHREELLMHAQDKLQRFWGIHGAIEKAEQTAVGTDASVVIASIQTICLDARLKSYPGGTFDLIIIDEAHHSVSRTYQKVLSHFGHTKVLGVTATPERADKKYLAEIYSSIAYEYPLLQAIHDGYLVNIEVKTIPLKLDISNVKETAGDYQLGDLGDALRPYLTQIADTMAVECRKKRTVVFLPIVELAKEFSEMLNLRGFRAAEIDCQSEKMKWRGFCLATVASARSSMAQVPSSGWTMTTKDVRSTFTTSCSSVPTSKLIQRIFSMESSWSSSTSRPTSRPHGSLCLLLYLSLDVSLAATLPCRFFAFTACNLTD